MRMVRERSGKAGNLGNETLGSSESLRPSASGNGEARKAMGGKTSKQVNEQMRIGKDGLPSLKIVRGAATYYGAKLESFPHRYAISHSPRSLTEDAEWARKITSKTSLGWGGDRG